MIVWAVLFRKGNADEERKNREILQQNRKRKTMKVNASYVRRLVRVMIYGYMALPVLIFFIGWCRWYIGIPCACVLACSVRGCMLEHRDAADFSYVLTSMHGRKMAAIVLLVLLWAGLSGVGGYVWQNTDHTIRNELFTLLVQEKWPLIKEMELVSANGVAGTQIRGLVYYIGYWLPAAAVGKLAGLSAGWAVQYLWAVAGILLMYAWICISRNKLAVWPLLVLIFFSGLDALGVLLTSSQGLTVFGDAHLEAWAPYYQFSSMTTQLFWVFNQAVPAWLLAALVFFGEKPRNLLFSASLTILTATFPFVGMLPFVLYFMVRRCTWEVQLWKNRGILGMLYSCLDNWGSFQNIAGTAVTGMICGIYISGNNAVRHSLPLLNSSRRGLFVVLGILAVLAGGTAVWAFVVRGRGVLLLKAAAAAFVSVFIYQIVRLSYVDWQSPLFYWVNLTVFYFLEAGVFLLVLYPVVKDRKLFLLTGVWLYVIPLVMIGNSCDFCMRASIPGLFLIMLWCIDALDVQTSQNFKWDSQTWARQKQKRACVLAVLLLIGAVTPLHEVKRSYLYTREYYENQTADQEEIFLGNNFSGSTAGFFWRYLAKL